MIEFALAAYLGTRDPITDVVADRIYADSAEQTAARPLLVYRLLPGSVRHYHSRGASGLVDALLEIACQGRNYPEARDLYEAVRNEIDGFQGEWDGTDVRRAALTPASSASGAPAQGDEVGFPSVRGVLEVFYRESIPTLGATP